MTIVRFTAGGRRSVGDHAVYFRQRWSDDWTISTNAHCTDCVWAASPTMPTATVIWPYGVIKTPYSNGYQAATKLTVSRWYVKVVFTTDVSTGATTTWYGVVSDIQDDQYGYVASSGTYYATGQQTLHCYGLEYLLAQSVIKSSWCYVGSDVLHETDLPITFNEDDIGNRNDLMYPVSDVDSAYVFDGTEVAFSASDESPWTTWSTREIVRYLLRWQGPSRSSAVYNRSVPFRLGAENILDNTDAPVVYQEGATVLSLLQRLIDRRRLLSFYIHVNADNEVVLYPFTFAASEIDFESETTWAIPANDSPVSLYYEWDELTNVAVRDVDAKAVDRVIVRGAHRTTTCSLYYDSGLLEAGWTSTNESTYETAASGDANYSTWDIKQKQGRNQEIRAREDLGRVFSWFRIPADWDGKIERPLGPSESDAFIDDEGRGIDTFYAHGIRILPYLPLYVGIDYSGAAIPNGTFEHPREPTYRRPFCTFKIPTDGRYVHGERIAQLSEGDYDPVNDGKNFRWSAFVRPQMKQRTIEVNIAGEPQHVIAETDFTALADDRDLGDFDYQNKEMFITVSLQEPRYAEGSYPAAGVPDATGVDAQRALVLYVGDQYRQDYVAWKTILDVDDSGSLTQSDGGYVRDDTDALAVIARVAYDWYTTDRSVLTLESKQLTNALSVGDMITTAGDITISSYTSHAQSINSPITSIRFQVPRSPVGSTTEPTMSIVTGAGELDPMTLLPGRMDR